MSISTCHLQRIRLDGIWRLARKHGQFKGHTGSVHAVAVTPDGRKAVSGSWDNTLKVWDLQTGDVISTFTVNPILEELAREGRIKIAAGKNGDMVSLTSR